MWHEQLKLFVALASHEILWLFDQIEIKGIEIYDKISLRNYVIIIGRWGRKESYARFLGNLQISRPSISINFQNLKDESTKLLRMDTETQILPFS